MRVTESEREGQVTLVSTLSIKGQVLPWCFLSSLQIALVEGMSGGLKQVTHLRVSSGSKTLHKVLCSLDVCGLGSHGLSSSPWTVIGSCKNGTQP